MGFATIGGLKIHYLAVTDPTAAKGQRVMYVHGTGCNTKVWVDHVEALADSHTPVAIDLPGHGRSEGCGFRGVADYCRFAAELARHLGWDRFVVAGHSLGGAIALATAVYHAEMVSGLMLIDTGARLRVHPDIFKAALEAAKTGRPPVLDRSWAFAKSTPRAVADEVEALTADADPWVTYGDWICNDSFDFSTRLKDIDVPAVAICGEEDRLTPLKYHQFFRQNMPRCQLASIANAGHWVYREQPEEFTRVVRGFLDGLPSAQEDRR
jgi:pimeloyl-ACP methyl ester carboxylesterase